MVWYLRTHLHMKLYKKYTVKNIYTDNNNVYANWSNGSVPRNKLIQKERFV